MEDGASWVPARPYPPRSRGSFEATHDLVRPSAYFSPCVHESSGRQNPVDGGFKHPHRERGVRIPAYLATRSEGRIVISIDALAEPKERI